MIRFLLVAALFLSVQIHAQRLSVYSQNLKGVKAVKVFASSRDSSGKVLSPNELSQEFFYDTSGNLTQQLDYSLGKITGKLYCDYDSSGRLIRRSSWSKQDGTEESSFVYRSDSTGRFVIRTGYRSAKIVTVQSTYWDSLTDREVTGTWYGSDTHCPASNQDEFDAHHRLRMHSIYGGFTEYGYDSLGNVTYMLMRHFENGECAGYDRVEISNTYANGKLVEQSYRSGSTWFSYNEQGFISMETSRSAYDGEIRVLTAEYAFYPK